MMARRKRKLTKAEREEMDARHARVRENVLRTRELAAADAAEREVPRGRMVQVEPAHRGGREHGVALGQRDSDALGVEQREEIGLRRMLGTRWIAEGGPDSAEPLRDQLLVRQPLVG